MLRSLGGGQIKKKNIKTTAANLKALKKIIIIINEKGAIWDTPPGGQTRIFKHTALRPNHSGQLSLTSVQKSSKSDAQF